MATTRVDLSVHPEAGEIRGRRLPDYGAGTFSILDIGPHVTIFIVERAVLDALQAALDTIRADMDAETAAAVA